MLKNIIILSISCLITLLSISASAELRKGAYERIDDKRIENETVHFYFLENGSFHFGDIKRVNGELIPTIIETGTYSENSQSIVFSTGKEYQILDDCRFIVDGHIYIQQACQSVYEGKTASFRPDNVLYLPNALIVRDSFEFLNYDTSERYALEFKLISTNPIQFQLINVAPPHESSTKVTGVYSFTEENPEKKLSAIEVLYVNARDHHLKYSATFKQINTNPYIFEVTNLYFSEVFDYWGEDVSSLYQ